MSDLEAIVDGVVPFALFLDDVTLLLFYGAGESQRLDSALLQRRLEQVAGVFGIVDVHVLHFGRHQRVPFHAFQVVFLEDPVVFTLHQSPTV